jgi:2-iminobutanoate/2-iminopropanoate deaminase
MEKSPRKRKPHFAPAVDASGFVFISGVLAFDEDDNAIRGDVAEQTAHCLRKVDVLLRERGLHRHHVVKTTVWLARAADFPAFNEAYALFFGDHRPARSTLICQLARPTALVEIEAIALKDART